MLKENEYNLKEGAAHEERMLKQAGFVIGGKEPIQEHVSQEDL